MNPAQWTADESVFREINNLTVDNTDNINDDGMDMRFERNELDFQPIDGINRN